MTTHETTHAHVASLMERILYEVKKLIVGQDNFLERVMVAMLAQGHILVEGVPGLAKTLTVKTLAATLSGGFKRIQFTPDLVPADLIGNRIYNQKTGEFTTSPGPIFTQLLLADEINRASPKTQSALLEAMEERQVSSEGITRPLPEPFFVIATQNPVDHLSTNPLPEAQLDRFLMRISLGYPDAVAELEVLRGEDRRELLDQMQPLLDPVALSALQRQVRGVHASDALLHYIRALAEHTRHAAGLAFGLSPRGALALLAAGRAWALLDGRDHVLPSDIQTVFPHVAMHRLGHGDARTALANAQTILEAVPLP